MSEHASGVDSVFLSILHVRYRENSKQILMSNI